jgi:predicted DNA-binding transcriptional regulator AlpA
MSEVTKIPERGERLLDKSQICKIANVTYPTVWAWMRAGKFPRARIVGGKTRGWRHFPSVHSRAIRRPQT